jgi:hypothetical protein
MRLCAAPVVRLEGPFGHKITILPSNETIRLNVRSLCVKKPQAFLVRFTRVDGELRAAHLAVSISDFLQQEMPHER